MYTQSMFLIKNKKKVYPCKYKKGLRGSTLHGHVSMMSLPTEYTNTARDFTSRDGDVYTYGRLKKKREKKQQQTTQTFRYFSHAMGCKYDQTGCCNFH